MSQYCIPKLKLNKFRVVEIPCNKELYEKFRPVDTSTIGDATPGQPVNAGSGLSKTQSTQIGIDILKQDKNDRDAAAVAAASVASPSNDVESDKVDK